MPEMCNKCGLPTELCVCEDVAKSQDSTVTVTTEERSYDKVVTTIKCDNIQTEDIDLDTLSSELKSEFACGGTVKEEKDNFTIELQGDHTDGVKESMEKRGFNVTVEES